MQVLLYAFDARRTVWVVCANYDSNAVFLAARVAAEMPSRALFFLYENMRQ